MAVREGICPCCGQSVLRAPWADRAFDFIAEYLDVSRAELLGEAQFGDIVFARRFFIWVLITYRPGASDGSIGLLLGRRDRTTIRHHRRVLKGLRERDTRFDALCSRFAAAHPVPLEKTHERTRR